MKYKIRGEFGKAFFEGTKSEVENVKKAMIEYGITEHKLHIVYPEFYDFKLPEHIHEKVYSELTGHLADGIDYASYKNEVARSQLDEMTDYDLFSEYESMVYSDEASELLAEMGEAFNSYKAEKILLE